MAIPTFTAVSPSTVHTAGQLITITGTNFRLPDEPPASTAPLPAPLPTVAVTVNGTACTNVRVYSATELTCDCPSLDPGPYAIQIQNLDNAGAAIVGETVTAAAAVTYARPDLSVDSDQKNVVEALILLLRRQLIANVQVTSSVDFDDETTVPNFVASAKLPALVCSFRSQENRNYLQDTWLFTNPDGSTFRKWNTFVAEDLVVTVRYIDNHEGRAINAQAAFKAIFMRTKVLAVDAVSYEIERTAEVRPLTTPNTSDLKSWEAELVIRGVEVQSMPGITDFGLRERGRVVDQDVVLSAVNKSP